MKSTACAEIAAIAQILDDAGLCAEAAALDRMLDSTFKGELRKEADALQAILSRLGGWARRALFKEYRDMYVLARDAQKRIDARITQLQGVNGELKEMLARHMLTEWREGLDTLMPAISLRAEDAMSAYDGQRAKMIAQVLKLAPKAPAGKPVMSPLIPQEKVEEPIPLTKRKVPAVEAPVTAPEEEPIPLTKRKTPETPVTPEEPIPLTKRTPEEAPAEPTVEPVEPTPTAEPAPATPATGWKKERFGTSGKHGWEWEWEISPDGNMLRLPKSQLAAASSGKGKILHRQNGMYRPTGGTSSVKLRRLMGDVYWKVDEDPSDPNMVILVRTDQEVPPPLSIRQQPIEQAKKLKEMSRSSEERIRRIVVLAETDEEKLEEAAEELLEKE